MLKDSIIENFISEVNINMDIYRVTKQISATGAVTVWLILLYKIFNSGGGFHEQLPKCIFATMGIFGLLTLIYKGVEHLEAKESSKLQKESNSQREEDSK